ncbi:MAG: hypothetical protein KGH62_00920 [Candidatus Micrarchaeota archaeon]|nr:hypothetical protein [Candidatus Micrarchaeota archaeon]
MVGAQATRKTKLDLVEFHLERRPDIEIVSKRIDTQPYFDLGRRMWAEEVDFHVATEHPTFNPQKLQKILESLAPDQVKPEGGARAFSVTRYQESILAKGTLHIGVIFFDELLGRALVTTEFRFSDPDILKQLTEKGVGRPASLTEQLKTDACPIELIEHLDISRRVRVYLYPTAESAEHGYNTVNIPRKAFRQLLRDGLVS